MDPRNQVTAGTGSETGHHRAAHARVDWVRVSVLPNRRLKLSAPVPNEFGCNLELRGDRLPFVNIPVWRCSLSAIR